MLTALDADAGLRIVADSRPDAIMVDLRMPIADGISFLRRPRSQELNRQTPVAIITGDYMVRHTLDPELAELRAELYFKLLWFGDLLSIAQQLLQKGAYPAQ